MSKIIRQLKNRCHKINAKIKEHMKKIHSWFSVIRQKKAAKNKTQTLIDTIFYIVMSICILSVVFATVSFCISTFSVNTSVEAALQQKLTQAGLDDIDINTYFNLQKQLREIRTEATQTDTLTFIYQIISGTLIGIAGYLIKKSSDSIDLVNSKTQKIEKTTSDIERKTKHLEKKHAKIEVSNKQLSNSTKVIEARIDSIEQRISSRVTELETQATDVLSLINQDIDSATSNVASIKKSINELEESRIQNNTFSHVNRVSLSILSAIMAIELNRNDNCSSYSYRNQFIINANQEIAQFKMFVEETLRSISQLDTQSQEQIKQKMRRETRELCDVLPSRDAITKDSDTSLLITTWIDDIDRIRNQLKPFYVHSH